MCQRRVKAKKLARLGVIEYLQYDWFREISRGGSTRVAHYREYQWISRKNPLNSTTEIFR